MALVQTSSPAFEPISVAEAKSHLRLDGAEEDALVASLILTSRLHIEAALGLALISQSWRLTLDRWPQGGTVALPLRPVRSITAVRVRAADGTPTLVPADAYLLEGQGLPPRLVATGAQLPAPGRAAAGVEIDLEAGFGALASDVPEPIRHALRLLVAHWYENREPVEIGAPDAAVPPRVSELLWSYRVPRL